MKKNKIKQIPSYVAGEYIKNNNLRLINDFNNNPHFEICEPTYWDIEASISNATITQNELKNIPLEKIINVLKTTMDHYFNDQKKYNDIILTSGSPKSFVINGMEYIKNWCKNIDKYLDNALPLGKEKYNSSSPVFAILPSNSEQESLYVISQIMASKNSGIIRPSSRGPGAYTAHEFIKSLNKTINDLKDNDLEPLRKSISIINYSNKEHLEQLSIPKWNYILFGSDNSVQIIKEEIENKCKNTDVLEEPRNIITYNSGLSKSIIFPDSNLETTVNKVLDSVISNNGNECVSTDIIYVHNDIYDSFNNLFLKKSNKIKSGNPFDINKIGLLMPHNIDTILKVIGEKGHIDYINYNIEDNKILIHPSLIKLHKYDNTHEYPGPIAGIRSFKTQEELIKLVDFDNKVNMKEKNLSTSVYTSNIKNYNEIKPYLQTFSCSLNIPTHEVDLMQEHQGIYLVKELVNKPILDRRKYE
ncbi:MAG: aldehyde dehydrogenase family protein [Nanoarchaeota archaeon]